MPLEKIQTGSVRRKIIFVFLTFAIAFAISFVISRTAFREMMERVEKITIPDLKLRLVHQINRDMIQMATSNSINEHYLSASQGVAASLDSLALLYETDSTQLTRIDSIKKLLRQRDSIFNIYTAVRSRIILNPIIENRLQSLERIIGESPTDSLIRSTEHQKIATRVTDKVSDQKDERGFFSRLFNPRRNVEETEAKRIVTEEIKVQIDTITADIENTAAEIGRVVQEIQSDQSQSRSQYISREIELANADGVLINTIFEILQTVEREALMQSEKENRQARAVVNDSINRISLVFIVVVLVIAIMVYFILADIRKNNAYRAALEATKEEAEYHAAAKQRFLANMSHELRTPLQSIVGYAEQLKLKQHAGDSMVDAIHQSTEHLLQIVNEILDYSRINSGKIILEEHRVDMHEITDNIIGIMQPLALKKNLTLTHSVQVDPELHLAGDPYRIRQILFNLLSNAIKFTENGSVSVDIVIRSLNAHSIIAKKSEMKKKVPAVLLDIRVADTGIGIADDNIERIFEDFEQAEQQEPDGIYKGSGLGLSIVKAICESMGGSITVESNLNVGTVFRVNLPLRVAADANEQELQPVPGPWETDRGNCGTVWIIDDDKLILQLCELILGKHNIPFRSFSSPQAALLASINENPDTVLMDIRMPGMDGFTLNRELRDKIPPHRTVRIYAFTAQALPEEQSVILSRGFDGILLKPFREKDLLNLLGFRPDEAALGPVGIGPVAVAGSLEKLAVTNANTSSAPTPLPMIGTNGGRIRELFIADTLNDLESLREQYQEQKLEEVSFTSHRLAGRLAQFGQDRLAFSFRKMEIDTRNGENPDSTFFENLLSGVHHYIRELREQQEQLYAGRTTGN